MASLVKWSGFYAGRAIVKCITLNRSFHVWAKEKESLLVMVTLQVTVEFR